MPERRIERWGESFDLADKIGLMPLMRFAHLARTGVDSDDLEGLDAMYTLLRQCIDSIDKCASCGARGGELRRDELDGEGKPLPCCKNQRVTNDWARFEDAASENRADGDELMAIVGDALTVMTARPTGRPSDSSGGSRTTSPSSVDDSSSEVIDRLLDKGRPDLALIVSQAQESRASA